MKKILSLLSFLLVSTLAMAQFDMPFVPTTVSGDKFAEDTHWYTMTIRGDKVLTAYQQEITCQPQDEVQTNNLWCFVGDQTDGFMIYNYDYGTTKALYTWSSGNGSSVYLYETSKECVKWTLNINNRGGYTFSYPNEPYACMNDYAVANYIALWNDWDSPNDGGSTISFEEYDLKDISGGETGGETGGDDPANVGPTVLKPITGDVTYVTLNTGKVVAFVDALLASSNLDGKKFTATDIKGNEYEYSGVEGVSKSAPEDFPTIDSFKFNNKFNDMLMEDADGEIKEDGSINITVGSIGKRLVASFKTSTDDALVYKVDELQASKKTSQRFDKPVTYTVTREGFTMLRETEQGEVGMYPYGRDYVVTADFLCDHPTNEIGVPVIRINTEDGQIIDSRDYYKNATITIDGAGYFPDMESTDAKVKGRGNSSWSQASPWYDPKNPYRIKFIEKQKPLGMKSGKNWNLIAQAQDGSMTTNVIGSRVAEMVGCDGANHFIPVELYINDTYKGSYCLTEKVGIANNSIDLEDETNAVMLELDQYDEPGQFFTRDYQLPVNIKYPDMEESTTLTKDMIIEHFNTFVTAVADGEDLSRYVDIPSLARFLIVNEFIVNQEIMHPKSTFLYNADITADSLYHFGPSWDFDWAFGYETGRKYFQNDMKFEYFEKSKMESVKFIHSLRYCGEKMDKEYYRVWTDFMNNHLAELIEYCDDYYEVAKRSFEHDNDLNWSGGQSRYKDITEQSKTWLQKRANYCYDYLSNKLGYADKGYLDPDPEDDPVVDGIEIATAAQPKAVGIFDLSGRKIQGTYESLPRGMYIVNGKKIMKR